LRSHLPKKMPKMSAGHKLVYVHDPMCSWCWGFNRVLVELKTLLPESIEINRLLGGLAPDSSEPMPRDLRRYIRATWKKIEETIPGTRFNHDFWTNCRPRRSTWPACRAVITARRQGLEFDLAMTHAIQRGYYLEAKNPSDDTVLIGFAAALGLDTAIFTTQLNSESTHQQLNEEIMQVRQLGVESFPSLVLLVGDSVKPIQINYSDADVMLESIIDYVSHSSGSGQLQNRFLSP